MSRNNTMSRTVLVVEDEAPIREMLKFVLEQSGFNIIEAEDFDIAQEKTLRALPRFNSTGLDATGWKRCTVG